MNAMVPGDWPDPDRVRAPLREVYRALDGALARLGPVCALSGRCCRFGEYGHTLFLSAAEAAVLLADAPPPSRPLDQGDTCPWQEEQGRCTARDARPLGCRAYFCDPAYAPHSADVNEAFIARLKRLSEALELPWNYAPLHQHLRQAEAAGLYHDPAARRGT